MKVRDIFEKSILFLKDRKIENPRLEMELILAAALNTDRIGIYLNYDRPLTDVEIEKLRAIVIRKGKGEPTAYLTGKKYFYGREFNVGPGVLIPRAETELIVEKAISYLQTKNVEDHLLVADFGSGSGCIGISIGIACGNAQIDLIEPSPQAMAYCQDNVKKLVKDSNQGQFQFIQSRVENWHPSKKYDLIVANPPYIATSDFEVSDSVKNYEPSMALYSGQDGFEAIEIWLQRVEEILLPKGEVYFEIGYKQGPEAVEKFRKNNLFSRVEIIKDFNQLDRVIKAVKNG